VEIIRGVYDAWLRGDASAVEAFDPEIVLYPAAESDWVGLEDSYRGPDGIARYLRLIAETIDDYRPQIVELRDVGDRVLTLAVESGRGKHSGAEVESRNTAHVWTLRDEKAVRLDLYWNRDRAFADLGLPPESEGKS
jgi:ketosteroid isomerase-like protein